MSISSPYFSLTAPTASSSSGPWLAGGNSGASSAKYRSKPAGESWRLIEARRVPGVSDHLSVSVYGVPCESTDLPKSRNQLSRGLYGGPRRTNATYMS